MLIVITIIRFNMTRFLPTARKKPWRKKQTNKQTKTKKTIHFKAWQWWRCTSFSTGVRIKTWASSHWRMIVKRYFCKRPQLRWRSRIRSTWFVTQSSSNGEDCITYRTLTSFQELTRASGGFLTVGGPAPCTFCTPGTEKSAIWLFRMIPESVIIPEPK